MTVAAGICCIPGMARVWSGKSPDKVALIEADRVVTYAQLNYRSNRVANTLVAAGIRPGSHVGYLGKNSAAFFEIWMGVNKAACALTPLNWPSAPAELVEVVHDAKVPLIFAGRDFSELAERVRQAAEITVEVIGDELDHWSSRAGSADPDICADRQHHRPAGLYVGHHRHPQGCADFAWRLDEVVPRRGDGA